MNLHNLATVITPNLFRPFELTANDLIFAQGMVETFKIMMSDYQEIFGVTEEPDEEEEIEAAARLLELDSSPFEKNQSNI